MRRFLRRVETTFRTTPRDDAGADRGGDEDAPQAVVDLLPSRRRRIGTFAFFGAIGLVAWIVAADGGDDSPSRSPVAASGSHAPGRTALEPGTYRLPGLSEAVSVTLPEGWVSGDSIWGRAGRGMAAISTGHPGASIAIAVFELTHLRPFAASSDRPRDRVGDRAWYERSLEDYRSRVEPRVRDRIVGRRLAWRPPWELAWLLTHTDRGPIEVADDVTIGGLNGDLVSFFFAGPTSQILDAPGTGTIALRPGVTYTFWVPTPHDASGATIMLGMARELGAVVGTAEWDVMRTLEIGS